MFMSIPHQAEMLTLVCSQYLPGTLLSFREVVYCWKLK